MAGAEGITTANPGTTEVVCAEETAADYLNTLDGQSIPSPALEYVPEKFKNDPDVVKAAIEADPVEKRASELTDEMIHDHNSQHRSDAVVAFKNDLYELKNAGLICYKMEERSFHKRESTKDGFYCERRIVGDPGNAEIVDISGYASEELKNDSGSAEKTTEAFDAEESNEPADTEKSSTSLPVKDQLGVGLGAAIQFPIETATEGVGAQILSRELSLF